MSPARPAHTETESSMMFMAAKPDTATRRRSSVSRLVSAPCFAVLHRRRGKTRLPQRGNHIGFAGAALPHDDAHPLCREIGPCALDTGHAHRRALDGTDAAAAAHIFDGKRDDAGRLVGLAQRLGAGTCGKRVDGHGASGTITRCFSR